MAITPTTNLNGTVPAAAANAVQVVLAEGANFVAVSIAGAGGARVAIGTAKVSAPALSTANSSLLGNSGYQTFKAQIGGGGITSIYLYANAGETTLTYDVIVAQSAETSPQY